MSTYCTLHMSTEPLAMRTTLNIYLRKFAVCKKICEKEKYLELN